jgi:hypothetical protein
MGHLNPDAMPLPEHRFRAWHTWWCVENEPPPTPDEDKGGEDAGGE